MILLYHFGSYRWRNVSSIQNVIFKEMDWNGDHHIKQNEPNWKSQIFVCFLSYVEWRSININKETKTQESKWRTGNEGVRKEAKKSDGMNRIKVHCKFHTETHILYKNKTKTATNMSFIFLMLCTSLSKLWHTHLRHIPRGLFSNKFAEENTNTQC
jgi:hypothetical protein